MLLLLFVGWQLWWTDVTANRTQDATVSTLTRDFARPGARPGRASSPSRCRSARPSPSCGSRGWVPTTPDRSSRAPAATSSSRASATTTAPCCPGAVGNFAVAGHRTTYGRPFHDIDKLRTGDLVVVETKTAYSVYAVKRHEIVAPTDVQVIAAGARQAGRQAHASAG